MVKAVDYKAKEAKIKLKNEAMLAAMARKEATHEAKRAAKEAKIAIKTAKESQKAEAKAIRQDKIMARWERKRRANINQDKKLVEIKLTEEFEPTDIAEKEVTKVAEKARREIENARSVEVDSYTATKAKEIKEINARLYEGTVNLILMPPAGVSQIKNLEERLRLIQNLRLILTRGSIDEPTRIIVSIERPIPLINILNQIPIVDHANRNGKDIQIFLKAGI